MGVVRGFFVLFFIFFSCDETHQLRQNFFLAVSHCPTSNKCCFGRSIRHAVFLLFKRRICSYLYSYFVLFSASRIVLSPETCAFFLEARHLKSSVPGPVWWGPTIFAFEGLNFYLGNGFFLNLSVRSVFCMKQYLGISKFIKSKKGNVWSGKPQDKRAIACTDKKNFVSIAKSRAFLYVTTLSDQVSWLKWGDGCSLRNTVCSFLFVTYCDYCAVLSVELFWKKKITQYSKNRKEYMCLCSSSFLWNKWRIC